MFTWSEQPIKDMWNHIRFLGKKENCKKLLTCTMSSGRRFGYLDTPALNRKVDQLSMCINQAYEYFSAADTVSIVTSPLLLFYGMLSLAKALIIADQENVFLEDIQYHGLHNKPINASLISYKSVSTNWTMEQEYAITNEGVFKHLTEVMEGFSFPKNSIFIFKNLLLICPEISGMYEKYYNEASNTMYLYDINEVISPYNLQLYFGTKEENDVYVRFPEVQNDFTMQPALYHGQARHFISKNQMRFPEYVGIYHSLVGSRYIVGGIKYELDSSILKRYTNPAIIDYIAVFILSTCVRYKQDFWGSIVSGEKSGVLGLIELYISTVKRRFPNIILDMLFREEFRYGSPGYLA